MTQLLETAYHRIAGLSEKEQDAMAAFILEALEDERKWSAQFAGSQYFLAELAREALAEHHAGNTLPLDPDAL